MNLALSSLIIFILVSPAIVFRRFYYTKEFSRAYISRNTLQEIFGSIFLSILLHAGWIIFLSFCGFREVDFEFLLLLLCKPDKINDFESFTLYPDNVFLYFLVLCLLSFLLAILGKKIIRNNKWDRIITYLNYDNKWAYILKGEVVDLEDYKKATKIAFEDIDTRFVDVLLKSKETIIYSGFLRDFQLSDNNSLDYIVMEGPIEKTTIRDRIEDSKIMVSTHTENLESHYFVIPYSEIANININYYAKPPEPKNSEPVKEKQTTTLELLHNNMKPKETSNELKEDSKTVSDPPNKNSARKTKRRKAKKKRK